MSGIRELHGNWDHAAIDQLWRYCFIGSAALTVIVEIVDASGKTLVAAQTLTISTTAKSIDNFFADVPATFTKATYAGMRILSISGGTLHFNTAGEPGGTNGIKSGGAPTTGSQSVLAGATFGVLA